MALIQLKHGLEANLPATGSIGEPVFTTDSKILRIWNGTIWVEIQNKNDLQAYVDDQITNLINGAPGVLDTLKELSDALAGDANFATTIANQIASLDGRITDLEDSATNGTLTAAQEEAIQESVASTFQDTSSIEFVWDPVNNYMLANVLEINGGSF